jgi:hypothetical protein
MGDTHDWDRAVNFGEGLREGAQPPPFRGLSGGVAGEAVSLPACSRFGAYEKDGEL